MELEKKFIVCEKMEADDESRTVVGWGSKPTIDRDKELIESDAWQLDNYRKNPVLLLCHKYDVPPIGKCLWVKSTPQGLRFKAQFAKTDRGEECYQLYKEGIMGAFSVGFKPRPGGVNDHPTDTRHKGCKRVFTDVELMEISCVPVPAHSDALVDHVKSGKIHTKQLNDELEIALEIIDKSADNQDDELEIVAKEDATESVEKSTDEETNTEIKIEVTEDFVHIPAPGEEGKHKECKIRTIALSKKDGIQAHYCIDDKTITSYIFDKKRWDKDAAVKWVEDHKKAISFEIPDDEKEPIQIKSEEAAWDEDGYIAFIDTKAVTPEKDEAEKDFMDRCMADLSMKKLNEGFRENACKLMWKKNQPMTKEVEPIEEKAATKKDDESEDEFVARFLADPKSVTDYPKDEDRMAAAMEAWGKCGDKKKKEPEPETVISKQESVDEFLTRILPERTSNVKTVEELAQVFVKAAGYDDMKETVSAMENQIARMEPVPEGAIATKSHDADGNPSLYDLTGAVDRALNYDFFANQNSQTGAIAPAYEQRYKSVVDIFAVSYPSGHVVYSAFDKEARITKYFQVDYEYDVTTRKVSFTSDPEEVLQSWISERYMIEPKAATEVETKTEEEIEAKAGRMFSAKNKTIMEECMAKMMEAHEAMKEMMGATEVEEEIPKTPAEEPVAKSEEEDDFEIEIKEPEEFEIETKEPDHIEIEETPADEGLIDVDEDIIKAAVNGALAKNVPNIDAKSIVQEAFARLRGRATL